MSGLLSDQFSTSWEELVNFDRLRKYRLSRVVSALKGEGLDAILVFKADNVRYVSSIRPLIWEAGYQTRNMVIADSRGNVSLFVASGDFQRVKENDPWLKDVKPLASLEDAGISSRVVEEQFIPELRKMGLLGSRIGIDATTLYTIDFLQKSLAKSGSTLEDGDEVMRKARAVKSSDELRLLKASSAIVDAGVEAARGMLAAGKTENETAGRALRTMYALGTEWMPSNPVVFSGPPPFRRFATGRPIEAGDRVVVELTAMNDGYCAGGSRTFIAGDAPVEGAADPELREAYGSVVKKLTPGTRLADLFATFRKWTHDAQAEASLTLRGTGLSLTDYPHATDPESAGTATLSEGMVAVVEARMTRLKKGVVQVSDTVHISGTGPVFLTKFQEG
ncbi:MAG: aminopeptidase P family protein [Thaumarchaeota archaeon]|nr:aminopeptidase P family protein [Nitrososphaerota archaeon]